MEEPPSRRFSQYHARTKVFAPDLDADELVLMSKISRIFGKLPPDGIIDVDGQRVVLSGGKISAIQG